MTLHCSRNRGLRPDRWKITGLGFGVSSFAQVLISLAIVWLDYLGVHSYIALIVSSHMVQGRRLGTVSLSIKKGLVSRLTCWWANFKKIEKVLFECYSNGNSLVVYQDLMPLIIFHWLNVLRTLWDSTKHKVTLINFQCLECFNAHFKSWDV